MATQSPSTFIPMSDPALQVFEPTAVLLPQGFGSANVTVVEIDQRSYKDYRVTNVTNNPGGNVDEVQFNTGTSFGGDNGLTYNATTDTMSTGNIAVSAAVTAGRLTVSGTTNLGAVGNVTITGGTAGQLLATNGSGVLSWANDANSAYGNSQVAAYLPTYTGNLAGGNAALGNAASANFFIGNGVSLFSIAGANVTGLVANASYADISGVAYSVAAANISGTVASATVAASANAVAGANVSGTVANATYADTAGVAYSVAGANVSGTVANATYAVTSGTAGTVTTNAQPNITSVGTLSALDVTGNTFSGNLLLDTAGVLEFSLGSQLTFGDVPVTNRFYVDPTRTDTAQYTANGSQAKPFATIAAALAVANASLFAPNYVILLGSITENVTLTKGHVFLVGADSTVGAPIVLTGTITVNGVGGTLDINHFSIEGLHVSAPGDMDGIRFIGTNPQRLFLNNIWLACASGGGNGLYASNSGIGSVINGKTIKVSHAGTGDIYCFNIQSGTASFWGVETSGATQVGSVYAGAVLTFNDSELDANGDTVLETYDTGMLVVTNSLIDNAAADSFGVKMNGSGGVVAIAQTAINVPLSATGQAVWLDPLALGGTLSFGGMSFYPGKNTTISPTLTMVPIVSMAGTLAYPIFAGNITANALPQSWSMYDNYTAALSFDAPGKTGILTLVTTNSAEGISSSGYVKTVATTIGALPAAATAGAGARSFVTDCDLVAAGNFGTVAAHTSGANATPVFSDGTNWRIG